MCFSFLCLEVWTLDCLKIQNNNTSTVPVPKKIYLDNLIKSVYAKFQLPMSISGDASPLANKCINTKRDVTLEKISKI